MNTACEQEDQTLKKNRTLHFPERLFLILPALQKTLVDFCFELVWEFALKNGGDFGWISFGLRFPRNEARKLLKKLGEGSEQNPGNNSGQKIEKFGELSFCNFSDLIISWELEVPLGPRACVRLVPFLFLFWGVPSMEQPELAIKFWTVLGAPLLSWVSGMKPWLAPASNLGVNPRAAGPKNRCLPVDQKFLHFEFWKHVFSVATPAVSASPCNPIWHMAGSRKSSRTASEPSGSCELSWHDL